MTGLCYHKIWYTSVLLSLRKGDYDFTPWTIIRLHSNLRQDHQRMRAFSYACSLPVTWQRWRLHHSIRRTRKPHAACKHHCYVFDRTGVIADRGFTLHCGNRNFRPFQLMWPWLWPDDLHTRTRPVVRGDTPHVHKLPTLRLLKVIVWRTYIHTDRQTRPKLYKCRFAGDQ